MLTGSCLCGSIAYEVDGPPGWIVHCHCKTCRKAHGTAFASVMIVPRTGFRWIRGQEFLASFESSLGKFRRFCSRCGSQLVSDRNGQREMTLRLGCLDTPITDRAKCHIWRSDAAPWYDPKDSIPELPEGFSYKRVHFERYRSPSQ
jgi:hypothetical protein